MSGSVRAEEGPTYMRGSSMDHRRSEKDKANIRTHIYRIQHQAQEESIDRSQYQTPEESSWVESKKITQESTNTITRTLRTMDPLNCPSIGPLHTEYFKGKVLSYPSDLLYFSQGSLQRQTKIVFWLFVLLCFSPVGQRFYKNFTFSYCK